MKNIVRILLILGFVAGLVILTNQFVSSEPSEPTDLVEALVEQFDWQNSQQEDVSKRTYTTKDFAHPTEPDKRILIQSSGLLHYHDGEDFKEIVELPFPEGMAIMSETNNLSMVNLPDWGEVEMSPDKRTVRVKDKQGVSIYKFIDPFVASADVDPFVISIDEFGEEVRTRDDSKVDLAEFEIKNNKLHVKPPKILKNSEYPLRAYDDTDTSSTNQGDVALKGGAFADLKFGTTTDTQVVRAQIGGTPVRGVFNWTLSSAPVAGATVTKIEHILEETNETGSASDMDIHELTQAFVETEATWNSYSDGNAWGTAGGDYDATIIDTLSAYPGIGSDAIWVLQGTGATNPLSLDWDDTVDLLIKARTESGAWELYVAYKDHATASKRPVLQITYTVPAPAATGVGIIIFEGL